MRRRLSAVVVALIALVAIASLVSTKSGVFISSAVETDREPLPSRRLTTVLAARLTRPVRPA